MEFTPDESDQYKRRLTAGEQSIRYEEFPGDSAMKFANFCLSLTLQDKAIFKWWNTPSPALYDRVPFEVWSESPQEVLDVARFIASAHKNLSS
jgi:hypothetical protein